MHIYDLLKKYVIFIPRKFSFNRVKWKGDINSSAVGNANFERYSAHNR